MMRGPWIQTYSGKKYFPLRPESTDVLLADIAHSLSMQCRFNGHCRVFFSVAQHSVLVSEQIEQYMRDRGFPASEIRDVAHWGLMHDASEAYLTDIPRPLKQGSIIGWLYRMAEKRNMEAICQRFLMTPQQPPLVEWADRRLLMTEKRDLMGKQPCEWEETGEPMPEKINPVLPHQAEAMFLHRFRELDSRKVAA